jgi:membrane protein required for colicin V production
MNWLDVVILAVLGLTCVIGVIRGLVREATSLLAVILAVVVAGWMYPQGIQMVRLVSARYQAPPIVGFALAFVLIYLALTALGFLVRRFLIYPLHLRWLDKLGGLVLGLFKGLTLVTSLVLIVVGVGLSRPASKSALLPFTMAGARVLSQVLPAQLRQQLMRRLDEIERLRRPLTAASQREDQGQSGW